MTYYARMVLQDCKRAYKYHTPSLRGEDLRISWVSIVTLLRAVGHVLHKVDKRKSKGMSEAIKQKWSQLNTSKPEPKIFWEFIYKERNNVIKTYQFGITRYSEIKGPEINGRPSRIRINAVSSRGGGSSREGRDLNPDATKISHIASGTFEGRKEANVVKDAIKWWEDYLNDIDRIAKRQAATLN